MVPPLLLTVDVEGIVKSSNYECVEILDELLSTLAVPATLFVTPAVLEARPGLVAAWEADGHALGLHIHPGRFGGESDWLGEYDAESIESFLARGGAVFADTLGREPQRFRAGRWSFSDSLLDALAAQGIPVDASHQPSELVEPYAHRGVAEYPLSVYGTPLLRALLSASPWHVDAVALTADAYLSTYLRSRLFRAATRQIIASDPAYVMVAFHDYDLVDPAFRRGLRDYIDALTQHHPAATLADLPRP